MMYPSSRETMMAALPSVRALTHREASKDECSSKSTVQAHEQRYGRWTNHSQNNIGYNNARDLSCGFVELYTHNRGSRHDAKKTHFLHRKFISFYTQAVLTLCKLRTMYSCRKAMRIKCTLFTKCLRSKQIEFFPITPPRVVFRSSELRAVKSSTVSSTTKKATWLSRSSFDRDGSKVNTIEGGVMMNNLLLLAPTFFSQNRTLQMQVCEFNAQQQQHRWCSCTIV